MGSDIGDKRATAACSSRATSWIGSALAPAIAGLTLAASSAARAPATGRSSFARARFAPASAFATSSSALAGTAASTASAAPVTALSGMEYRIIESTDADKRHYRVLM